MLRPAAKAEILANTKAVDLFKQFNDANSIFGEIVEVDVQTRNYILEFTQKRLGLELPLHFFHLTNLRRNNFNLGSMGGVSYSGDELSQKRFSLICEIERNFDEDITVDLFFPKESIFPVDLLKVPHFECSDFITEQVMPGLFYSKKTFDVEAYSDYPKHIQSLYIPRPFGKSHSEVVSERREKYLDWIHDHFLFETHEMEDRQVMSCRFSYLRQHTAKLFPAPILLKNVNFEVRYRIRSKHSSSIATGTFTLKTE